MQCSWTTENNNLTGKVIRKRSYQTIKTRNIIQRNIEKDNKFYLRGNAGHLIECDKKSEIVRYFQGRLCDKIGLLCDFFRANLHCFTRFQRRKTTLMLFNGQFECKGIIKHLI